MIGSNKDALINQDTAIGDALRLLKLRETLVLPEWQCDCREKPSANCPVHGESVKAVLEARGLSIERSELASDDFA